MLCQFLQAAVKISDQETLDRCMVTFHPPPNPATPLQLPLPPPPPPNGKEGFYRSDNNDSSTYSEDCCCLYH